MAERGKGVSGGRFKAAPAVACLVCLAVAAACSGFGGPHLPGSVVLDRPAPDFEVRDRAGRVHRLSDFRGKVVLINFWATWCPPCLEEMPSMESLRKADGRDPIADHRPQRGRFLGAGRHLSQAEVLRFRNLFPTSSRKSPNSMAPTWFPRPISWTSRASSCARWSETGTGRNLP